VFPMSILLGDCVDQQQCFFDEIAMTHSGTRRPGSPVMNKEETTYDEEQGSDSKRSES
jgi:hypothetical protein